MFNILAPWFIIVLFDFFSIHTSHALSRSSPATALLNLWLFEGKLDLPMRSICNFFFFFFFFSEHKLESRCLLIETIVYFHPIRRCYEFLDLLLQEWQTHTLERWVENDWCCIENEDITFCEVLFAQDVSHWTWYVDEFCLFLLAAKPSPLPFLFLWHLTGENMLVIKARLNGQLMILFAGWIDEPGMCGNHASQPFPWQYTQELFYKEVWTPLILSFPLFCL